MTTLFIEPVDVLALRGNRLFEGPGSYDPGLMPPWPSVAAGAIRSHLLAVDRMDLQAFADGRAMHAALGLPGAPGPFTLTAFNVARRVAGHVEPLFALPADLEIAMRENQKSVERMRPVRLAKGLLASSGLPELPVLPVRNRGKPESGYWLTAEGWRAYLAASVIRVEHVVHASTLWSWDIRVGLGLDAATGRADDGRLFTVSAVALRKDQGTGDSVGFVAEVAGAELPGAGVLRFGGDGRGARYEVVQVDWPAPDFEAIARAGRARLVLTTPGIFAEGWHLPGTRQDGDGRVALELHGVKGHVVAAAVPRAGVVSGYDLATRRPKPSVRAVPAGSVYWVEELACDAAALRKLVSIGLWPSDQHPDPRRPEGYNRIAVASF